MNNEQADRLLVEILDIAKDIDPEVFAWVRDEVTGRTAGGDQGVVEAWLAESDDEGPMGNRRNRVVLLHQSSARVDNVILPLAVPGWIVRRHIYDATAVSSRRAVGRPDPLQAKALRFVAMNCADGAEEEFHAWYEKDHLPRFTEVPGVLEGRRLHSADSPRHHLALYWLEGIDVVRDPRWKAAAGTDWTAAMRAKTFDRDRINLVPFPGMPPA